MPTNISALPLVEGTDTLRDNEDWLFSIAFQTPGLAVGYPSPANSGTGTIAVNSAGPGAKIGGSTVLVTSVNNGVASFVVSTPDGIPVGIGSSSAPFNQGGLSFTLLNGSPSLQVGDSFIIYVQGVALDLTGLSFAMQVRTLENSEQIYADANSSNGQLINGTSSGTLAVNILRAVKAIPIGNYGFDIIATGDGVSRCCVAGTLNVIAGYTHTV